MFEVLKKCFSINLNEYKYIGVDLEINKIILCTAVVLMACIVVFNTYRANIKLTVSQLVRHKAKDEESAKTLSELGLDKSRAIKKLLGKDNMLTKIVARCGEKKYGYDEYMALSDEEKKECEEFDVTESRFYIREEYSLHATNVIDKYGTSVCRTILSCVLIAIISISLFLSMPGILNVLNNLLKNTKM
ncbi:MAG: hypothetical protein IKC61_04070 [Clostridia bacterium]|nr:hypothetical protein [Clostridia bacterium]